MGMPTRQFRRPGPARLLAYVAALVGLAAAACSVLEPQADTSRYFLLRPVVEPPSGASLGDLVLGLGPVTLPDHLDRVEMLDLVGPYELRYSSQYRWAEPLGEQVHRILAANLQTLLQPDEIVAYPWFASEGVGLQVEVAFDALRLEESGLWRASVGWTVRDPERYTALERGDFALVLEGDSIPPDRMASDLSAELGRLSREIAAGVRRHHR